MSRAVFSPSATPAGGSSAGQLLRENWRFRWGWWFGGVGVGVGGAGRMDYAPCSGQRCGSRRSTPGLQGRRAAASTIGRPFGNWRPCLQRFDSAGALDQRVMGRRCDELAESGSRDFCFSTRVGFGSLAEDALPLNNASSLSILHRRLGTGLGSLASPIGGAAENAGSSALAGAPCPCHSKPFGGRGRG